MIALEKLYREHSGKVSDKWQSYLRVYDDVLAPFRERECSLLEIGVQNGGSLELWSRYLPAAEHIVGLDIDDRCGTLAFADPRIRVMTGDATDPSIVAEVRKCVGALDVIIDDGSHRGPDIVGTFLSYFPLLRDGGVFIAEDLHCAYWREYDGGLYHPRSAMAFFRGLADVINKQHWRIETSREAFIGEFLDPRQKDLPVQARLERVHSVSFYNSLCVIRCEPEEANQLGARIVKGEKAIPGMGPDPVGVTLNPPDQTASPWSRRVTHDDRGGPGAGQDECRRLREEVVASRKSLEALRRSRSWRLTAPARRGVAGLKALALEIHMRIRRHRYHQWIKRYDTLDQQTRKNLATEARDLSSPPLISVVMPVYNARLDWLEAAVASVRDQLYPYWQLCIADDASTAPGVREWLIQLAAGDQRISLALRDTNGHICAASNTALAMARGEWVALLDQDDLLPEYALSFVARAIRENPGLELIYSDEDKLDARGRRCEPYFKPDWNLDLFLSQNMFSHFGVYRRELVEQVGGFRESFEGSQDYDLALRCVERIEHGQIHHIPRVLYHWRIHGGSASGGGDVKPYARVSAERALNQHLTRTGIAGTARSTRFGYRIRYHLPPAPPLVTVIMNAKTAEDAFETQIPALVGATDYPELEVLIVAPGSAGARQHRFEALCGTVLVREIAPPQSAATVPARLDAAVTAARGSVLVFIDSAVTTFSEGWLEEMAAHALRQGVGAVGGRLCTPRGRLTGAGLVTGLGKDHIAGVLHQGLRRGHPGYFGRAALVSAFSAVSATAMAMRKSVFQAVGGFDTRGRPGLWWDVDFCLRLRDAGYRNVVTPYAEFECPVGQGRLCAEDAAAQAYMRRRWGTALLEDPGYNPNLTLDRPDCSPAFPPRQP